MTCLMCGKDAGKLDYCQDCASFIPNIEELYSHFKVIYPEDEESVKQPEEQPYWVGEPPPMTDEMEEELCLQPYS